MINPDLSIYEYVKTFKGYDIYSYYSFISGEVEGYTAFKEGATPSRSNSLLKGLLAPSIKAMTKILNEWQ